MIYHQPLFDDATGSDSGEPARADRFLPVSEEETAFAMSLFVGAASGELAERSPDTGSAESAETCARLLRTLSRGVRSVLRDDSARQYLCSLDAAFRMMWKHYEGDERQASVCARVLGFYYLMQESGGAVVERWVSVCEGSDEVVVLHPAVVETLAGIPLSAEGVLSRELFVSRLEARAM